MAYTTTLIDGGDRAIVGTFGTLTSLGLTAGESASLFHDTDNDIIVVNYTLSAIPEPSAFAFISGFLALGWIGVRRRR